MASASSDSSAVSSDGESTITIPVSKAPAPNWAKLPEHLVHPKSRKLGPIQKRFKKICEHEWFELIVGGVIIANAFWIGYEMEMFKGQAKAPLDLSWWLENTFAVVFVGEIVARYLASYGIVDFLTGKLRNWNIFDTILVALMILEVWVLYYAMPEMQSGTLKQASVLRLLRVTKILRLTKFLRIIPEIRTFVMALYATARTVILTILLLFVAMYCWGVLMTSWAVDHDTNELINGHFSSLTGSILTMFQIMIYDDAFAIIREVMGLNRWMGFALLIYVLLASFTFLNMLIGIICQVISDTKKLEDAKYFIREVRKTFEFLDKDRTGQLTKEMYLHEKCRELLANHRINFETGLALFDFIDRDRNGTVDLEEFTSFLFKFTSPPESADLLVSTENIIRIGEHLGIHMMPQPMMKIENGFISHMFEETNLGARKGIKINPARKLAHAGEFKDD